MSARAAILCAAALSVSRLAVCGAAPLDQVACDSGDEGRGMILILRPERAYLVVTFRGSRNAQVEPGLTRGKPCILEPFTNPFKHGGGPSGHSVPSLRVAAPTIPMIRDPTVDSAVHLLRQYTDVEEAWRDLKAQVVVPGTVFPELRQELLKCVTLAQTARQGDG